MWLMHYKLQAIFIFKFTGTAFSHFILLKPIMRHQFYQLKIGNYPGTLEFLP